MSLIISRVMLHRWCFLWHNKVQNHPPLSLKREVNVAYEMNLPKQIILNSVE